MNNNHTEAPQCSLFVFRKFMNISPQAAYYAIQCLFFSLFLEIPRNTNTVNVLWKRIMEYSQNYWTSVSVPQPAEINTIAMKPKLNLVSPCHNNQILCDRLPYVHCSTDNKWSSSGFTHNNVSYKPNVRIYKQMKSVSLLFSDRYEA